MLVAAAVALKHDHALEPELQQAGRHADTGAAAANDNNAGVDSHLRPLRARSHLLCRANITRLAALATHGEFSRGSTLDNANGSNT